MIAEWDNWWVLQTPYGWLPLNQPISTGDARWFLLDPEKCTALLPVRSTEDDAPQQDGKIPHRRWRSGYTVHLAIELLSSYDPDSKEAEPACGEDAVALLDLLGLHLNSMIRTGLIQGEPDARLIFHPSGHDERMFDLCQLAGAPTVSQEGKLGGLLVEVDIDCAFPYYMEWAETTTDISDTQTKTILNPGNTDFFPVLRAYGPFTAFTLTNHSVQDLDGVDLKIDYDDSLPGGFAVANGHYVEINFFRGAVYLDGNVARRKASINWAKSDLFPLIAGDNSIEAEFIGTGGATKARFLTNGAWG